MPISLPAPLRAAIFDMDGTLIDTEAAQHASFIAAGKVVGRPLPHAVLDAMVGVNRDACERLLAQRMGPDFPVARFYAIADEVLEAEIAKGLPLRPGARAILDHLRDTGVPIALATSTIGGLAQLRLEQAGLLEYFSVIVTRSDVTNAKPHPEPYLLAANLLGFDPAHCLAVEDSYAGVASATAAGIPTVMVPDLLPATEAQARAVVAVLPSLDALREMLQPAEA